MVTAESAGLEELQDLREQRGSGTCLEWGGQVRLLRGDIQLKDYYPLSKWVRSVGHSRCVQMEEANKSIWS